MEYCVLKPSSTDYSVKLKSNLISVILNGGASKFRKTLGSKSKTVNVMWEVNNINYSYIIAFYYMTMATSFTISLIDELGITTDRICKIVPGTFSVSIKNQFAYSVKCTLEIVS